MSTDPTAEHIDAVARAVHAASWSWLNPHNAAHIADTLLTSTDPAVHAALAASLPAEVMLAALVDRGTLTERWGIAMAVNRSVVRMDSEKGAKQGARTYGGAVMRRYVTPWEVAP